MDELLKQLPNYLGGHILLSLAALAVGLVVSVPLGIAVSRRPRLAELTLTVAGIVQTVPSLALLALMVLVLGMIGFEPAFVALSLYSILPILASTVTGIRGVDPTLIEAARGLGLNDRQVLYRVQLPLAAPVVISGIRTATVLVVGTATLVSPVGGRSLGNYIFQGLESLNHASVLFGCVLVAALAILLDQLVHLFEIAAQRRERRLVWAGALGLVLLLAVGIYPLIGRYVFGRGNWVHVGSGSFTEQHILSEVIGQQLEPAGFRADKRKSMSEGIQFMALRENEIDCMVNYTGNIWTLLMKRTEFPDRDAVREEVTRYLREEYGGVVCLGSLGFENAYAFAMRGDKADELGIRTIEDLSRHAHKLKLATDLQFTVRPEWDKVRKAYGLEFKDIRPMEPSLMYDALKAKGGNGDGDVDVIVAYTTDGRINAYKLKRLEDPKHAFPPYDAVLLLSPKAATRPGFTNALQPLLDDIKEDTIRQANQDVDGGTQSVPEAAMRIRGKLGKSK